MCKLWRQLLSQMAQLLLFPPHNAFLFLWPNTSALFHQVYYKASVTELKRRSRNTFNKVWKQWMGCIQIVS